MLSPVRCSWSRWSSWSRCSRSCEGGIKSRSKKDHQGGEFCANNKIETNECNKKKCPGDLFFFFFLIFLPVDCKMGPWSEWSDCSQTCGLGGSKTRNRSVEEKEQYGGNCNFPTTTTENCNRNTHCSGNFISKFHKSMIHPRPMHCNGRQIYE